MYHVVSESFKQGPDDGQRLRVTGRASRATAKASGDNLKWPSSIVAEGTHTYKDGSKKFGTMHKYSYYQFVPKGDYDDAGMPIPTAPLPPDAEYVTYESVKQV